MLKNHLLVAHGRVILAPQSDAFLDHFWGAYYAGVANRLRENSLQAELRTSKVASP